MLCPYNPKGRGPGICGGYARGFIESPTKGVKCSGCWKAYSNECEARRLFEEYKKCTCLYLKEMENGRSLESLVVDTRKIQVAV